MKESFEKFVETFYPYCKLKAKAVNDMAECMGYYAKSKKRLEPGTNPVYVFEGMFFDSDKLEKDLQNKAKEYQNHDKNEEMIVNVIREISEAIENINGKLTTRVFDV